MYRLLTPAVLERGRGGGVGGGREGGAATAPAPPPAAPDAAGAPTNDHGLALSSRRRPQRRCVAVVTATAVAAATAAAAAAAAAAPDNGEAASPAPPRDPASASASDSDDDNTNSKSKTDAIDPDWVAKSADVDDEETISDSGGALIAPSAPLPPPLTLPPPRLADLLPSMSARRVSLRAPFFQHARSVPRCKTTTKNLHNTTYTPA